MFFVHKQYQISSEICGWEADLLQQASTVAKEEPNEKVFALYGYALGVNALEGVRVVASVVEPVFQGICQFFALEFRSSFWLMTVCPAYNFLGSVAAFVESFSIVNFVFFREPEELAGYFQERQQKAAGLQNRLNFYDAPPDILNIDDKKVEEAWKRKDLAPIQEERDTLLDMTLKGMISFAANKLTLPSQVVSAIPTIVPLQKGLCETKYNSTILERHKVQTSDGVNLQVNLLRAKKIEGKTPKTLLFFQGNMGMCDRSIRSVSWLYETLEEKGEPFNVVFFDYRGCGGSEGHYTRTKDLLLDGYAVSQWVRQKLQTDPKDLYFYGHSLGGGVAAEVMALDDSLTGKFINDRSFYALGDVIESVAARFIPNFLMTPEDVAKFLRQQGFCLDSAKALRHIKGDKLIMSHRDDKIIPFDFSLKNYVDHSDIETEVLSLEDCHWGVQREIESHNSPVRDFDQRARDTLVSFILS